MTIGKSPHRIQGKKGADEWDMREEYARSPEKARLPPLDGQDKPDAYEGSTDESLESRQVGGSRPGVESRVKNAIADREHREEREEEE